MTSRRRAVATNAMAFSPAACLFLVAILSLPGPGMGSYLSSKHLQCVFCGAHSALVNPVLLAMFLLLRDLIGSVDVALCLTLHIVYISVIILERVLAINLGEIISGLSYLLRKVSNEYQYSRILELIGLLLTGVFSCVLSALDNALIW